MQLKDLTQHRRAIQVVAVPIIFAAIVLVFGSYQFVEKHGHASTRPVRETSLSEGESVKRVMRWQD